MLFPKETVKSQPKVDSGQTSHGIGVTLVCCPAKSPALFGIIELTISIMKPVKILMWHELATPAVFRVKFLINS